jgi:hypothetical protein
MAVQSLSNLPHQSFLGKRLLEKPHSPGRTPCRTTVSSAYPEIESTLISGIEADPFGKVAVSHVRDYNIRYHQVEIGDP